MDKQIIDMNKEELNTILRPIGKATYKDGQENPNPKSKKKKAMPNDKIECDVCHKIYSRANRNKHRQTQFHQERARLQKKLIALLLD